MKIRNLSQDENEALIYAGKWRMAVILVLQRRLILASSVFSSVTEPPSVPSGTSPANNGQRARNNGGGLR